jgi:hypothetical protein
MSVHKAVLNRTPTEDLLYELYDRLDDNLFAPERRADDYLDGIERPEKMALCQSLRVIYEDYKDS